MLSNLCIKPKRNIFNLLFYLVYLFISVSVYASTIFSTGTYSDNQSLSSTLSIPDTQWLTVTVKGNTEANYDFITIYDSGNNQLAKFSGNIDEVFSVKGNLINVKFTSDARVTDTGVTVSISKPEILPPASWKTLSFEHEFAGVVHIPEKKAFFVAAGDKRILQLDEQNLSLQNTITIPDASRLTSITYLNGYIWVGDISTRYVYKIDVAANTYQSFSISSFPDGIGNDGQYIYVVSNDRSGVLNIINPSNGQKVGILTTTVPDPVGITFDGNNLIVLDESGKVFKVNRVTGQTIYLFSVPAKVTTNSWYGPEDISYIYGVMVIGYGLENQIAFAEVEKSIPFQTPLPASSVSNMANIFENIAEINNGTIYLPRVGGDFQTDIINVQLKLTDAAKSIFELQPNWQTEPKKEGVSVQYNSVSQVVTLPISSTNNGYCRNIYLKLVESMPMRFQLMLAEILPKDDACGHSLNSLLNNVQITQVNYSQTPLPYAAVPNNRVYLLIHGMNSDPETWNDLVDYWINSSLFKDQWGNRYKPATILIPASADRSAVCPEILANSNTAYIYNAFMDGNYPNNYTEAVNGNGRCYRIRFGTHYRYGLDGSTKWDKGDGATFDQLGKEVGDAVKLILLNQPNAEIILVGHSRGGLAARAFLQSNSPERSAVKGLLTIGTPHLGSPFGRIYQWLQVHSKVSCFNLPCELEWELLDFLSTTGLLEGRSPTIGDLAIDSLAINTLNHNVNNLPIHIVYGQIISSQNNFLNLKYNIEVFDASVGAGLSEGASNYLLNGHSREFYLGDGIVPTISQQMQSIVGFPAKHIYEMQLNTPTFHISETGEVNAIDAMLQQMFPTGVL